MENDKKIVSIVIKNKLKCKKVSCKKEENYVAFI